MEAHGSKNDGGMTLARFEALLDAYGARPTNWPDVEREEAVALLARSPEARGLQARAERLDVALDMSSAPSPSPGLADRIVAVASTMTRVPAIPAVAARAAGIPPIERSETPAPRRISQRRVATLPRAANGSRALRRRLAWTIIPLAAVASIALWLAPPRARTPRVELSEAAVAALGTLSLPTDSLLAGTDVGDLFPAPQFGCDETMLGCPAAVAPTDRRSGTPLPTGAVREAYS